MTEGGVRGPDELPRGPTDPPGTAALGNLLSSANYSTHSRPPFCAADATAILRLELGLLGIPLGEEDERVDGSAQARRQLLRLRSGLRRIGQLYSTGRAVTSGLGRAPEMQ